MRIHKIFIVLLLLLNSYTLSAHSGKARYHAIIETDGNQNDLRTISLLLASKEIEVIGIYCTKEIYPSTESKEAVRSLLHKFKHEGVPHGSSPEFLEQLYQNEEEAITYVCLTSLRSLAEHVCTNTSLKENTNQIIWYTPDTEGFAGLVHEFYPEGYSIIKASGVPLVHLGDGTGRLAVIDKKFQKQADKINSRYTAQIIEAEHHTHISEELTAIYLQDPAIFQEMESKAFPGDKIYRPISHKSVTATYLEMLKEKEPDYKILSHIPLETEYYKEDVAIFLDDIVNRHGESEWRAGVLCFELHGHIGIYAIIGVKMGLRAREYFNIGLDDLYIESHAGLKPPVSCLNDGLQVSTGSTLGHGLISAEETEHPEVSAIFSFKDSKIQISLKPETAARLKEDIRRCINENGKLTPSYWEAVRALALEYWLHLDRNQIFSIKKV